MSQGPFARLFRDSSALRSDSLSRAIFTTTASADFSQALPREISPSKVRSLSARAVRLYLTQFSVTSDFALTRMLIPVPGLTAGSCSYGRAFATASFRFASRLPLAGRYGLRHVSRSPPFR
jgi:hypothetical protein